MNEIDKKALRNQLWPTDYMDDLTAIKNHCVIKYEGSYLGWAITCFNYGVMIGKRQERRKLAKLRSENVKLKYTLTKIMKYVEDII